MDSKLMFFIADMWQLFLFGFDFDQSKETLEKYFQEFGFSEEEKKQKVYDYLKNAIFLSDSVFKRDQVARQALMVLTGKQ